MSASAALLDLQRAALEQVERDEAELAQLFARAMRTRAEVARLWDDGTARTASFAIMELAGTARIGQVRAGGQLDRARHAAFRGESRAR